MPGRPGRLRVDPGSLLEPIAGYSRAVRIGDRILVSGTTATHTDGSDDLSRRRRGPDGLYPRQDRRLDRRRSAARWTMSFARASISRMPPSGNRHRGSHGRVFGHVRPANTLLEIGALVGPYEVEIEASGGRYRLKENEMDDGITRFSTPRDDGLGLVRIENAAGLAVDVLPNGNLFAISHREKRGTIMINQVLGAPTAAGIGRILLRTRRRGAFVAPIVGGGDCRFRPRRNRLRLAGSERPLFHRVTLALDADSAVWFWRVEITNRGDAAVPFDLLAVQDVGLGGRGFLMGSEAYASQYLDHHVETHAAFGPVVMSRQGIRPGRPPSLAGAGLPRRRRLLRHRRDAAFRSCLPPRRRGRPPLGSDLAGSVLQHEVAARPSLQSRARDAGARRDGGDDLLRPVPRRSSPRPPARPICLLDSIAAKAGALAQPRAATAPVPGISLLDTAPLATGEADRRCRDRGALS